MSAEAWVWRKAWKLTRGSPSDLHADRHSQLNWVRVPECAEILEISRTTAYAAARAGDIPTIKVGGRLLVPVAGLKRKLGVNQNMI